MLCEVDDRVILKETIKLQQQLMKKILYNVKSGQ